MRAVELGATNIMWWLGHMVDFGQVPPGLGNQIGYLATRRSGTTHYPISILIRIIMGNSSVQPMNENHSLDCLCDFE